MNNNQKETPTKAQSIALSHYARKDIQQAMFDFCKHRETVANFNNKFFAKRPDTLDYPQDILNQARQGATSFHCSEEIWDNPLDINTDMTPEQYNEIRTGWDFLIDIDSPFLDYGKIAVKLIIKELESHGVKNFGIKFSGGKGFHIIVPFKAFPEEVNGELTKDNFPEWPRLIAGYIFRQIREPMNKEILSLTSRKKLRDQGELKTEHICPKCKKPTIKKKKYTYFCPNIKCKSKLEGFTKKRLEMLCPSCNSKMNLIKEEEIDFCESCNLDSSKFGLSDKIPGSSKPRYKIKTEVILESKNSPTTTSPNFIQMRKEDAGFKIEDTIKSTEDSVDVILVSSRHLFRAPYSLHEKTAFASIVLTKDQIENFTPSDADPLKIIKPKSFMPEVIEGEAKELLLEALSWGAQNKPKEKTKKYEGKGIDMKGLTITENMYPPIINKILKGIPQDGRKRALGLLLSFFTSLEFPQDFIEEKIDGWNNKNYQPLKQGYIKSQITWSLKNKRLPPNYDKPIYKEFGIHNPPEPGMKNPINYTIKQAMRTNAQPFKKQKNTNQI